MSTIILKGTDKKLECTISLCEKINKMKEDGVNPKTPLNISGTVVELGEIRYAIKDGETDKQMSRDDKKSDNGERLRKYQKDFEDEINYYLNGSLEKKLQFNLRIAKMYCLAITGKDVDEYKSLLKPIFLEELKTKKLVVKPSKYMKLFKVEEVIGDKDLTKVDYIIRGAPLRIMHNYIQEVYDLIK